MKRAVLLYLSIILFSAILYSSCRESAIEVPSPPREVSMNVSGTMSNWNLGDGYSLIAVAEMPSADDSRKEGLDTAAINSNGEFSLVLHAIYDKYCTYAVVTNEPNCNNNINPSPYNMRQAKIGMEIWRSGVYKGQVTGIVHRVGLDTIGTYYITFRGYSAAGTITGFKLCVNNDTTYTTSYDYNMNTFAGWTKVVTTVVFRDTNYVAYQESNNDPQYGVVWEYSLK